jgi:hypothetical protein
MLLYGASTPLVTSINGEGVSIYPEFDILIISFIQNLLTHL